MRRHFASLERRVAARSEVQATLLLENQLGKRQVRAKLRVELGPLGPTLVGREAASTPDAAARMVVDDVERQLERLTSRQRGEPTFGVPSRREPRHPRPLSRERAP